MTCCTVLANSFKPPAGVVQRVTVYPSDYGLEKMKEEETQGPGRLIREALPTTREPADEVWRGQSLLSCFSLLLSLSPLSSLSSLSYSFPLIQRVFVSDRTSKAGDGSFESLSAPATAILLRNR